MDEDMKANELSYKDLMLGDWIKPKNVDANFRVGLIGVSSVWNDTDTHEWYYDEIEPIPLTTEILEKNGFKKSERTRFGAGYFLKGENFELDNPSNPNNYLDYYWLLISIKSVRINYIHQLQHALRLCGIDKTIEL